ncbi:MAG: FAD-dependent oxidoreductase [Candidatus Adiutrix sp.]|jgi:NADPH-dependent 2,4-dienoyl-CoA reductase/sulfur reductase-like enzyme|nr:FAD-dependent oxidoreductase [Candidatus Adiutrix sp.]
MKILVIGGDAAGMSAASQIRRRQPSWTVEVFEMGQRVSCALCGSPYFISGLIKDIERLVAVTPERFEKERGIKIRLRHEVTAIHPARKSLTVRNLDSGQSREENYDRLVMATGAEAIEPKGLEAGPAGLFYLRSLADAERLREAALGAKSAAVVGAGYLGLEITEALVRAGLSVTLLGRRPAPSFETELQNMAQMALARPEVTFRPGLEAVGLARAAEGGLEVAVSQGRPVRADLAVVGAGLRPRSGLAAAAGLALGDRGAVAVDRCQRTSNPFIYAAGDCAESYHLVSKKGAYIPLALGANRQGKTAGLNISGLREKSPGVLGTSIMKVFDLALAGTGLGLEAARRAGFPYAVKTVVRQPSKPDYYPGGSEVVCVVIHDPITGRLLGGQLGGTVDGVGQRINTLAAALTAGMTVKEAAGIDAAYAPPFAPVHDPVIIACEIASKNSGSGGGTRRS